MKDLIEDIKELLKEIIAKAYEVNQNTEHTVFLIFSGHVEWLELGIHLNGWQNDKGYDIKMTAYLSEIDAKKQLEEMLKKLEKLEG